MEILFNYLTNGFSLGSKFLINQWNRQNNAESRFCLGTMLPYLGYLGLVTCQESYIHEQESLHAPLYYLFSRRHLGQSLGFAQIIMYSYRFVVDRFVKPQLEDTSMMIVFFFVLSCVTRLHLQEPSFLVRLICVYTGQ